jgi:hypothetical protein
VVANLEHGDEMMNRLYQFGTAAIVVVLVLGISACSQKYMNTDDKSKNNSNDTAIFRGCILNLQCTLPTERPSMSAMTISYPEISNSSNAKSYAVQLFPEFNDSVFELDSPGDYFAMHEDTMIDVYQTGTIIYIKNLERDVVDIDDYPIETAMSDSNDFIDDHGGLLSYELDYYSTIEIIGENYQPTGEIQGYNIIYRTDLNGYSVEGADRIQTTVYATGPTVGLYYRCILQLGSPQEPIQVISAQSAWNAIDNESFRSDVIINITDVGLCYFINNNMDLVPIIYPAWRFSGDDRDLFVNAFTGEFYIP